MSHPLHIAFIWHMHQPYYRDLATGACSMPWVRLHGTKDYLDMVKLLETYPAIHQTVNVVPSLIDQLEDYLPPRNQSDQFLDLSRKPASELTEEEKRFVISWFFMANWEFMIAPHPRYGDLLAKRGADPKESDWPAILGRFKPQDYLDLQVWFNLVWIDPWLRSQDPILAALEAKGQHFSEADKQHVLAKQLELLHQILPTYQAAQARGQLELTTSAYYHPILPLLCDLKSAREALPDLPLPAQAFRHPEDADWHVREALRRHEQVFGKSPQGMWPPEGSVSEEMIRVCLSHHLRWIATDEEILWKTLRAAPNPSLLYRPHRISRAEGELAMIFRDRELSDLIGFVYSRWEPQRAVHDFLNRLGRIHHELERDPHPSLVSIILDGENAWESYPRDGYEFLSTLYGALSKDPRFRVVTVSEFLDQFPLDQTPSLPEVTAGSWINGSFATWIGHPEKNQAWAQLAEARATLLHAAQSDAARANANALQHAWQSFYIAEGSDWMWWFGDTHSSAQDAEFDRLFRLHAANVYRFLGRPVPSALEIPIKPVTSYAVIQPTGTLRPVIDGRDTTYYEWLYAGRVDFRKGYSAVHRGRQCLLGMAFGFDASRLYLRFDVEPALLHALKAWTIRVDCVDRALSLEVHGEEARLISTTLQGRAEATMQAAYGRLVELAVPQALLQLQPSTRLPLRIHLLHQTEQLEQYPAHGAYHLEIPPKDFESHLWSA